MKQSEIEKRLASIDVSLAKQSTILEEHIRRTGAAEHRIEMLQEELEPIKTHVAMVHGAFKLVGIISVLSGIAVGLVELIRQSSK